MPSWLYMIDRGATTVWERWDGIRPDGTPFESLNHYSKGAVVSFLHRYVAGIRLLDDGGPATATSGSSRCPAARSRGRRQSTTARTAGSSRRGGSTATRLS